MREQIRACLLDEFEPGHIEGAVNVPPLEAGLPWTALAAPLRKLGEGPDSPLGRSEIDLRSGLLVAEGFQRPPCLPLGSLPSSRVAPLISSGWPAST